MRPWSRRARSTSASDYAGRAAVILDAPGGPSDDTPGWIALGLAVLLAVDLGRFLCRWRVVRVDDGDRRAVGGTELARAVGEGVMLVALLTYALGWWP